MKKHILQWEELHVTASCRNATYTDNIYNFIVTDQGQSWPSLPILCNTDSERVHRNLGIEPTTLWPRLTTIPPHCLRTAIWALKTQSKQIWPRSLKNQIQGETQYYCWHSTFGQNTEFMLRFKDISRTFKVEAKNYRWCSTPPPTNTVEPGL